MRTERRILMNSNRANSNGRKFIRQRPSGRWLAEIKDCLQKLMLWLRTFDRAEDAAMAYDCAARILRDRNAKTNFPVSPGNIINPHNEEICRFLGKNPRAYQLLEHAISKNHAVLSSSVYSTDIMPWRNQMVRPENGFDMLVEETIVCSSSSSEKEGSDVLCRASVGSSKVYSSVVVAPSFSASLSQREDI